MIKKVWNHDDKEYIENAKQILTETFPPKSKITVSIKNVNKNGTARTIAVYGIWNNRISNLSVEVCRLLGWRYDYSRKGVYVEGCGGDMGFFLAYTLGQKLYGYEYALDRDEV